MSLHPKSYDVGILDFLNKHLDFPPVGGDRLEIKLRMFDRSATKVCSLSHCNSKLGLIV